MLTWITPELVLSYPTLVLSLSRKIEIEKTALNHDRFEKFWKVGIRFFFKKSLKNSLKPFLWMAIMPQRGGSLLFTTKFPGGAGD